MSRRSFLGSQAGFTILEGMVALSVSLLMLSISIRAVAPVREASSVRSADQVFRSMVTLARSHAIERGQPVQLRVDVSGDSAWVTRGNQLVDRYDFRGELDVDLISKRPITVCLMPNGVADANCSSPALADLSFQQGGTSRAVQILPTGHVVAN
jgi:Tfp pilus assembly protein FimT